MSDQQCSVAVDDVRLVCTGLAMLTQGLALNNVPISLGPGAMQALARIAQAADAGAMPECPVSTAEEAAVTDAHVIEAYESHGFSRDEAFHILTMNVEARLRVAVARAANGC